MTQSLFDILSNKDWDVPPEVQSIKRYIKEHFKTEVRVGIQDTAILITAPNAALAGTLRLHSRVIQKAAATDKRLIIRIG